MADQRPAPDTILQQIADYVLDFKAESTLARDTAHMDLFDALGCGFPAHDHPECRKVLGPVVEGITAQHGARVPCTSYELDPVTAAFNISALNRWLDFNDSISARKGAIRPITSGPFSPLPIICRKYAALRERRRSPWRTC